LPAISADPSARYTLGLTGFASHSGVSIYCQDVVFDMRDGSGETGTAPLGVTDEANVCDGR